MLSFLLYLFILLFPLGELIRIDIGNSIVFKPLDFVAVVILLVTILQHGKKLYEAKQPIIKPLYFFIGAGIISLILNIPVLKDIQLLAAFMYLLRFVAYGSVYFAVMFSSKKTKRIITTLLFITSILIIFMGFVQFAYYTNLVNLRYLGWDPHWWRLYATFFDPNYAGVYLTLFLMLSLDKTINTKGISKIIFGIISLMALIAVMLTFSRSAFIALLAGLFTYVLYFKKSRKIVLIVLFLFTIGIILILTHSSNAYTEGTKLFRPVSSIARIKSLEAGWFIFSRQPIFGVGFNAYRYAQLRYGTANAANWEISHSNAGIDDSFLFVMGTTGVIGSIAFFLLLKQIYSTLRKNQLAISTLTSVIVGSLFINALFFPVIMGWMWIIWSLSAIEKE